MLSASRAAATRESSTSARAGTIAWASPPAPGTTASFTLRPVAVGGGHRHPAVAELDQDAGQHRPRLVSGRRPGDVVDRRHERLPLHREGRARGIRQVREVLGPLGVQRVLARAAQDPHGTRARRLLDGDVGLWQSPDDLEQEPARQHGRPGVLHLGGNGDSQRELHVGGGQLDRATRLGAQQHTREDLDGGPLRHAAGGNLQTSEQLVLRTDDLHTVEATSCSTGSTRRIELKRL